ncbi:MarC family protein [Reinekea blandensis]|nr:MarC family protein [Reinekea blandensis]
MNTTFFFNALTSYFVVIDPIGCALIFYSLTLGQSTRQKAKTILKSMAIALGIILSFAIAGERLLTALGISMDALRVAGGILLFNTAFRMITKVPEDQSLHHESPHDVRIGHITVYPLAIPLMAGPGTLTLTVLLMANGEQTVDQVMVIVAAVIVLLVTVLLSVLSGKLRKVLGQTGDEIIQRLLGVLLAALAIQFVANGVNGLFLS